MTDRNSGRPPIGGIKQVPTNAVFFDENNPDAITTTFDAGDYADCSEFTVAVRFKMITRSVNSDLIFRMLATNTAAGPTVSITSTGIMEATIISGGFNQLNMNPSFTVDDDIWYTLLVSGSNPEGQAVVYLDDVLVSSSATWGADGDTALANNARTGLLDLVEPHMQISRMFVDITKEIDFRVEANRRKFFDTDNNPVEIDITGMGLNPFFYMGDGMKAYQWNRGENMGSMLGITNTSGAVTDV